MRLLSRDEIVPTLRKVHDDLALGRAGGITRPEVWWTMSLGRRLDQGGHMLAAVHTGPAGDDGFAVAVLADPPGSLYERTVEIIDLHAADVTATAELWRFLLGIDLIAVLEAHQRPLDEPLELLLGDPRACTTTGQDDETWLRLVDVPLALAARSFGPSEPVLIAVHDPLRETNAGIYRIADGAADRVGPLGGPVRPELECSVDALAMAYLGDRSPSQLVATGWWEVHDPEAVPRADAAFATAEIPWCGTHF